MKRAHLDDTCKPCAYFYKQEDGCRNGYNCKFCHLCPKNELRMRRRTRKQALSANKANRAQESGAPESCAQAEFGAQNRPRANKANRAQESGAQDRPRREGKETL